MRYSKLFGKTVKDTPADARMISHKYLYKGGFIRESTAGRYYLLPLGMLVQQKIIKIIKEEMDQAGSHELSAPVMHPLELWQETNRTKTTGFELTVVQDRHGAKFALGGTAEEMMVDLVRKFQLSYKDLPFSIYQFSTKFRDELRARGGLLRVREFIMKDAYSFHADAEDFKKEYQHMWETYKKIFEYLGLKTTIVESDNGYIGGEYCHEFVVENDVGESKYLVSEDGSYAAHEDVAKFKRDEKNLDEKLNELQEVEAKRDTTMEDGVQLHKLPLWQQIKDVLYVDETGRYVLAILRGDYNVNEVKLLHAANAIQLRPATDEEIRTDLNSEPGFISPVNLKQQMIKGKEIVIVGDISLRTIKNAYGGANKKYRDLLNMNIDRDYQLDIEADIALAENGFITEIGKRKLTLKKGIEVGNIFQLGYHYSKLMRNAEFTDKLGKKQKYYMGCYGIGIGRTMAAVVEVSHDKTGIIWPKIIAPFQVILVGLDLEDKNVNKKSEKLYEYLLKKKVEVLYDDRNNISAGEKFADADLIGIPLRIVISKRTGEQFEIKFRTSKESKSVSKEELLKLAK